MENTMNNKKVLIVIIAIVILIGVIFLVRGCSSSSEKMNDLDITYSKGKVLSYDNFSKSFSDKRTITVKNNSKQNKTYSLEWVDVNNTLKKQNKFLYEIECSGDRCATLGKSQIPVAGAKVFPQVLIKPGSKQVYTVKLNYSGSEKDVKFKGTLQVYSEKTSKKEEELKNKQSEKIKTDSETAKAKEKGN